MILARNRFLLVRDLFNNYYNFSPSLVLTTLSQVFLKMSLELFSRHLHCSLNAVVLYIFSTIKTVMRKQAVCFTVMTYE